MALPGNWKSLTNRTNLYFIISYNTRVSPMALSNGHTIYIYTTRI